jgi:ribonuclease VapC
VIPFNEEQSYPTGSLCRVGHTYGLSLGDQACLVLARATSAKAVTADRAWQELDLGIKIKLIL